MEKVTDMNSVIHISIHAPVKGATIKLELLFSNPADFNPRTREGCDGLVERFFFK